MPEGIRNYPPPIQMLVYVLLAIAFGFILIIARDFLYPIVLSALFAFLLYPAAAKLEDWGVARILANLICVLLAIAILYIVVRLISEKLMSFMNDFDEMRRNAAENIDKMETAIEDKVGMENNGSEGWLKKRVNKVIVTGSTHLNEAITTTAGTVVKIALMPVYVFFMLYYRDKVQMFILQILKPDKHIRIKAAIDEVSQSMRRYMRGIVIVVAILSVVNSIGLMIVGIKYPILMGILSAVMNFIPYFGTLIGGAIPLLYALLIEGNTDHALGVLGLFIFIQFLENNILTPNITGDQVNLNPFATILSIIVGGMLWGIPGMFAAVPIVAIFKIFSGYIPGMQPFNFLLGTKGTEDHSLTWKKIRNVFRKKKD